MTTLYALIVRIFRCCTSHGWGRLYGREFGRTWDEARIQRIEAIRAENERMLRERKGLL
jgi:hypothetical protein